MSEQKESSVLFSLKELMNLEEDRIRTEEADRSARAAQEAQARAEAERRAREEEEARIRAEEERRRNDDMRTREEVARLEAIRVAEIEKARVDAEQRARMEAMAAQQSHERSLAAIHGDESKQRLRKILIAVAVAVPLIGGTAGFFIYKESQRSQAEQAALVAEQQRLADEKKKLEASMAEQQKKIDNLLADLANAKDDLAARRPPEAAPGGAAEGAGHPAAARVAGLAPVVPRRLRLLPKCTPGDPLCSIFDQQGARP
ncbi:MAG: hypothetical protein WKG00_28155 [Polyangiaceae bacterium]